MSPKQSAGAAAGVAIACLLATVPGLAGVPAIGPGREAEVLRLIRPYVDEGEITAGVRLPRVEIAPDGIRLHLRDSHGATAEVRLRPLGHGQGRSFALELPGNAGPELRLAADALAAAIARNDDGRFFPPGAAGAAAVPLAAASSNPLWGSLQTWAAALAWLMLAVAVAGGLRQRRRLGPGRLGAWRLAVALLVLALAVWARLEAPLTPLHANDHAFEDMAVIVDAPGAGPATARQVEHYGASWLLLQRALTRVLGAHHDGVGLGAVVVGGAATLFAFLAALAARSSLWAALLGAVAMALAPAAVRVGHSESALVVAQLLVALGLWAALALPGLWQKLAVGAVLVLLAGGHVLGPPLALAVALLAWSIGPLDPASAAPPTAAAGLALPPPPPLLRWPRPLLRLGLYLGLAGLASAGALALRSDVIGERLGALPTLLPFPSRPHEFSLWLDPRWAPSLLPGLALVGLAGLWLRARNEDGGRWPLVRLLAFALGLAGLVASGLVVVACIADALRYQSTLAPALVVAVGQAPLVLGPARGLVRHGLRLLLLCGGLAVVVQLAAARPGCEVLGAQGEAYHHLRQALGDRHGQIRLLVPPRTAGSANVVFQAPAGLWTASGPEGIELRLDELATACAAEADVPPFWVWLPPGCDTGPREAPGCAEAAAFIDPSRPALRGAVHPFASSGPLGLRAEYLSYRTALPSWQLAPGRCPAKARARARP